MKSLIREIRVNLGMSIDKNGLWVKPDIGLTITVSEEDNKVENRAQLFERAFKVVEEEMGKELDRLEIKV